MLVTSRREILITALLSLVALVMFYVTMQPRSPYPVIVGAIAPPLSVQAPLQ